MPDPTSPRRGIAAMMYKQYAGQQQVDVACRIELPGSCFGATESGGLSSAEKKEKYEAVAMEYDEKHVFEPAGGARKPAKIFEGIRFVCPSSDAADNANHPGFWMNLTEWNHYRNDTFKKNRDAELPYLPTTELQLVKLAAAPAQQTTTDAKGVPLVYAYFKFVKKGTHTLVPRDGGESQEVPCEWYECCKKVKGCKVNGSPPIKVRLH